MNDLHYALIALVPVVILVAVVAYYFRQWQRSKGRG